ncbi:MAG: InlB B-repeat-containing protein [Deltaproteobacteria bacterium]|nr:InlB B-repeat-containing protein [Deltaproteobacteria bacterium]
MDGNGYQQGDQVTVLGPNTLVKTGYTFNGWNTAAHGSGTQYAAGAKFNMPSANVILYAKWADGSKRYVCNDGECGGNTPCHKTISEAVEAATTGTLIMIAAEEYDADFSLTVDKDLTLQGGWDNSFENPNGGTTTLHGAPKAPQGSLIFQNLKIVP